MTAALPVEESSISTSHYLYLCGIRLCSFMVLWLDFILIFSTLTFLFTSSAQTLALAASLYGLPALLLGPYLGSMADRHDPRVIIAIGFTLRFAAACALFAAPSVGVFLLFIALKGLSNLGSTAAEVVLTKQLLTTSQIVKNTSLVTIMDQSIKILSPVIAGVMTALSVKASGFLVSAAFCLLGLLFLALLVPAGLTSATGPATNRNPGKRFVLHYFKRHSTARLFLFCMLIQSAALGLYDSMLGLFLKEVGENATAFGIIVSATALGGICAGFAFPHLHGKHRRYCSSIASAGFGLALLGAGFASIFSQGFVLELLSALFFLAGFAYGLTSQGFTTTLQLTCPTRRLGTTFATTRSLSITLFIGFPILGGWLADISSTTHVLITAGIATTLGAYLLHYHFRGSEQ